MQRRDDITLPSSFIECHCSHQVGRRECALPSGEESQAAPVTAVLPHCHAFSQRRRVIEHSLRKCPCLFSRINSTCRMPSRVIKARRKEEQVERRAWKAPPRQEMSPLSQGTSALSLPVREWYSLSRQGGHCHACQPCHARNGRNVGSASPPQNSQCGRCPHTPSNECRPTITPSEVSMVGRKQGECHHLEEKDIQRRRSSHPESVLGRAFTEFCCCQQHTGLFGFLRPRQPRHTMSHREEKFRRWEYVNREESLRSCRRPGCHTATPRHSLACFRGLASQAAVTDFSHLELTATL